MKFGEFLKRDTSGKGVVVTSSAVAKLERELKGGGGLASLFESKGRLFDDLPLEHLREIAESYRRYRIWRNRAAQLGRRLESVEREVISRTTRLHQLSVIERALKLAEQARVEALDRPGVLSVALELWDTSRVETRRRGSIRCDTMRDDHPHNERYADVIGARDRLEDLTPHRWLAMRRGERERVLSLELDLDKVGLVEQAKVRHGRFGKASLERSSESLLEELVLNDLREAVFEDLDEWARAESIRCACEAYEGLLRARPLRLDRLGALYLDAPDQPVGVAIVDGEGAVLDFKELDTGDRGWRDGVLRFFEVSKIRHVAVPSDTRSSKRLADLEARLREVTTIPVRTGAMREARKTLTGPDADLSRAVAYAAILARRALDPMKAWGQLDPIRVGVGEYPSEISEEELRDALLVTREVVRRRKTKPVAAAKPVVAKPTAVGAGVKTASELRPGMLVSGQVTNITGFGAFVSLGLEYEGMVHVSELSDDFVSNPNEVVKIGDRVNARVLAVDPKRRRISLSLRSEPDRNERRGPRRSGGPQRNQALRDLEKLFSK